METATADPTTDEVRGQYWSGTDAAKVLGVTYRRIDHHLRTIGTLEGKLTPGSGNPRCLTPPDLFAIGMIALIRENLGGSAIDFEALLPRLYAAYEENARVVLDTEDHAVTVVVDGTEMRDQINEAWVDQFGAVEDPSA